MYYSQPAAALMAKFLLALKVTLLLLNFSLCAYLVCFYIVMHFGSLHVGKPSKGNECLLNGKPPKKVSPICYQQNGQMMMNLRMSW